MRTATEGGFRRNSKGTLFMMVGAVVLMLLAWAMPAGATTNPVFHAGNPDCEDLGFDGGFKIDHGAIDGTYTFTSAYGVLTGGYLDDPGNSVTIDGYISGGSELFDWTATIGLDAVIVKGGPNANVWFYDPEATSDTGLHAPVNPTNGKFYAISHIEICYDYEVEVSKTANTSFDRDWSWDIDKTGSHTSLTLAEGQQFQVTYHLDVWARSTDSNWAVDGVITIDNPAPFTATITDVSDEISGTGPVPVDCGVTFPYDLEAFGTLECTYGSSLPDGTTRTNTATATTTGVVGSGSGMASVDFSTATIDETDETISVNDPFGGGYLGDVTAPEPQGDIDFTYTHWIVADDLDCGRNEVVNTATFTTNDTGTQGSDSWTIVVEVTCSNTCTLTQGYWKTHSDLGPAPYDDNWANLPNGAATEFFDTGHSWYEVFWTPPKGGNPFYILAHQYQAAYLNMLNGSSVPGDVAIALSEAATLLDANDSPPKINKKSSDGEDALALAGILAAYNEGLIGPGHCSE